MSKENDVLQAHDSLRLILLELQPNSEVKAPVVEFAQIDATIMVAQAVDRLTELLRPLVDRAMAQIKKDEDAAATGRQV